MRDPRYPPGCCFESGRMWRSSTCRRDSWLHPPCDCCHKEMDERGLSEAVFAERRAALVAKAFVMDSVDGCSTCAAAKVEAAEAGHLVTVLAFCGGSYGSLSDAKKSPGISFKVFVSREGIAKLRPDAPKPSSPFTAVEAVRLAKDFMRKHLVPCSLVRLEEAELHGRGYFVRLRVFGVDPYDVISASKWQTESVWTLFVDANGGVTFGLPKSETRAARRLEVEVSVTMPDGLTEGLKAAAENLAKAGEHVQAAVDGLSGLGKE